MITFLSFAEENVFIGIINTNDKISHLVGQENYYVWNKSRLHGCLVASVKFQFADSTSSWKLNCKNKCSICNPQRSPVEQIRLYSAKQFSNSFLDFQYWFFTRWTCSWNSLNYSINIFLNDIIDYNSHPFHWFQYF